MACTKLIECAALVRAVRSGELDELQIPVAPLDILAQQIVAISASDEFGEDDLFALARSAFPYRALDRKDFDAVIEMLSESAISMKSFTPSKRSTGSPLSAFATRVGAIVSSSWPALFKFPD